MCSDRRHVSHTKIQTRAGVPDINSKHDRDTVKHEANGLPAHVTSPQLHPTTAAWVVLLLLFEQTAEACGRICGKVRDHTRGAKHNDRTSATQWIFRITLKQILY
jgi:hypothetical protein